MQDEVTIHEMDKTESIFLFQFNNVEDTKRILKGRPWSIQGHLLNLQPWDDQMIIEDVDFSLAPFWVQFHGLPMAAFDNDSAIVLGNAVGDTLMIEQPKIADKIQRSFLRVRVLVDLKEPLIDFLSVPRKNKDPAKVSVKY